MDEEVEEPDGELHARLSRARPELDAIARAVMRASAARALFGASAAVRIGRYELVHEVVEAGVASLPRAARIPNSAATPNARMGSAFMPGVDEVPRWLLRKKPQYGSRKSELSAAWSLPPHPVPSRHTFDDRGTRTTLVVGASSR